MANTTAQEVYDAFESTFSDKKEIPELLELQWLKMAVGKYNMEIAIDTTISFDQELLEFDSELDQYVINTLGQMIRVMYEERNASRADKIASIVGKDISINSNMSLSKYAHEELKYHALKESDMIENQKPTAMV